MVDLLFKLTVSSESLTEEEIEQIEGIVNTCCSKIEQVKRDLNINLDVSPIY